MRIVIPVFFVIFFVIIFVLSCGGSVVNAVVVSKDDSICNVERNAASEVFKSGEFGLPETRQYLYGPYVEEAFYILFGIKPRVPVYNDVVGLPPSCYDKMIDSLILAKYGADAFERALLYADNLHSVDPQRYRGECFYSPTYMPNNDSLTADLRKIIHYPASAKRDSLSGTVYVRLEIDSTGSVTNAVVQKGVRHDLDSTAVDAALRLGKFRIERRWGIGQAGQVIIPIKFALK
jgi:TonB family protein